MRQSVSRPWPEKRCWPTPRLSAWPPWCARLWCPRPRHSCRRTMSRGSGRRSWRSACARNPLTPNAARCPYGGQIATPHSCPESNHDRSSQQRRGGCRRVQGRGRLLREERRCGHRTASAWQSGYRPGTGALMSSYWVFDPERAGANTPLPPSMPSWRSAGPMTAGVAGSERVRRDSPTTTLDPALVRLLRRSPGFRIRVPTMKAGRAWPTGITPPHWKSPRSPEASWRSRVALLPCRQQ